MTERNAKTCHCGNESATATESWSGRLLGEECLLFESPYVKIDSLTRDDIERELRNAIDPRSDYQTEAVGTIASLIMYQQERIVDLEAAMTKLAEKNRE